MKVFGVKFALPKMRLNIMLKTMIHFQKKKSKLTGHQNSDFNKVQITHNYATHK